LFFDYNGNGVQDGQEPAVAGALVQLEDNAGNVIAETLSDSSGDYKLEDIKSGPYRLHIGVEHFSDKQLTYMCTSPSEFKAVTEGYDLQLQENVNLEIGLMEGFLTQPVSSRTRFNSSRLLYDWNPDPERSLWWSGRAGSDTQDHGGHDYDMRDGEPVLAAAPGKVHIVSLDPQVDASGKGLLVQHHVHSLGDYHYFFSDYWHISDCLVQVGQWVSRGQLIARSGHTWNQKIPHLHFGLYRDDFPWKIIDPYSPVFEVKPKNNGYWTLDKDHPDTAPHIWVPWTSRETNPNVLNYWTKRNDPQFPLTQSS
jgi:hypothetical protein